MTAQNETKKWYFGYGGALDFMTNPPSVLANNSMTVDEGCASMADNNGNLLFYTDGMTIWNSTHTVMANGTGLNGGHSSTQAALILKKPGSSTIYYVYTVIGNTWFQGLNYSEVDMSLASGQGSVTAKNVNLFSGSLHEKLTATKHCNGTDFWILVRDFSYFNMNDNGNFHAYQLSSAGMNTTAVVSAFTYSTYFHFIGAMKISPNGRKLACANYNYSMQYDTFELFDFDNSTGVVTNSLALMNNFPNNGNSFFASGYGVEFSPDGTKLYGALGNFYATFNNGNIIEWDLCAGSNSAIVASQTTVCAASGTNYFGVGSMQLASDGKIYVAHSTNSANVEALSVINNPNGYGTACNFSYGTQTVTSFDPHWGLPNFSGHYFMQPLPVSPPFTFTTSTSCFGAAFTAPVVQNTLTSCTASSYSITGYAWDFGDVLSGSNNTSFLVNPTHTFSGPGTYTTQLILYYSCGGGIDTLRQAITVNGSSLVVNTASITCASLGSGTLGISSGSGNYTYSWSPTNHSTSIANGLIPGNYTISVNDINLNCSVTNTVYFAPLIPLTGNITNSYSITCNGASTGSANCTDLAGGSANQNYVWYNGNVSYATASVSNLSGGQWSVSVTDALTACQINSVFTVIEPTPISTTITASSPTACVGANHMLTGYCSGGTPNYTYLWSSNSTSSMASVSQNSGGNYVYTLTVYDSNSCSIHQTTTVQFISKPVITVSDVTICPLHTGTLVALGATTYTWNNSASTNYLIDSPVANTNYTVIGTALGCTNSANASIYIKPTPALVFTSNSPVCEGQALTFAMNTGTAFAWSGPNNFSSSVKNNTLSSSSLNQSGVYQVTVTSINSCTANISGTLTVKPLPLVTITNANPSVCLNVQTISLLSSGSATLFSWTPTLGLNSFNQSSINVSPPSTKVYSVSGTLNGCTSMASATVNVVAPPNLLLTLYSQSLCLKPLNGSPNAIILAASGAANYTITAPGYFSNSNPAGPQSVLATLPPYALPLPITTVTLSGSNGVCTVNTTKPLYIVSNPTVYITNVLPVICEGQSHTFTATGASTYNWSSANPSNFIQGTGSHAVVTPIVTGTGSQPIFSVYGQSLGCNSASESATLAVNPLPTIDVWPKESFVCIGSSENLKVTGNGTSFAWSPANSLRSNTGLTVIAQPTLQQSYTVVASLKNCTQSAVAVVSVVSLPIPTITAPKQSFCVNDEVVLVGNGGVGYNWQGPTVSNTGKELKFKAFSHNQSGTYTLLVSDFNNCVGSTTYELNLFKQPSGYVFAESGKGCVPFCTNFSFIENKVELASPVEAVSWRINNAIFSGTQFSNCFTIPGEYDVLGTIKDANNCTNTLTYHVIASEKPNANFEYSPLNPTEEIDLVTFTANKDFYKQEWFIGLEDEKSNSRVSSNTYFNRTFSRAGTFPVVLSVENVYGCKDTIIKLVKVEEDFVVYVPKAFTPNSDNKNELFMPVIRSAKEIEFQVFDKWGTKIFETNQPEQGWDGTVNGKECKQDVYVWKLFVKTSNSSFENRTKSFVGEVTLYR
jgi:gliding motility-associated-like protein